MRVDYLFSKENKAMEERPRKNWTELIHREEMVMRRTDAAHDAKKVCTRSSISNV